MALDDAKAVIKDQLIKWQELQRLADDPTMAPFFAALTSSNGNLRSGQQATHVADSETASLIGTVEEVCRALSGQFTIKHVLAGMKSRGFPFGGNPQTAVGNSLRTLAKRGILFVKRESSGRRAKVYEIAPTVHALSHK